MYKYSHFEYIIKIIIIKQKLQKLNYNHKIIIKNGLI